MYEYNVRSKWAGWFGGWGSEGDVAAIMDETATHGWRLVRTESIHALWFWFIPRPKLLFVFERERSNQE